MFKGLNKEELRELKKAVNTIIERRVTFNSTDKTQNDNNRYYLRVDHKLLSYILQAEEKNKMN